MENNLPAGFTLDQAPSPQADQPSSLPEGFQLDSEKYGSGAQGIIGGIEQVAKGALGPLATVGELALGVPKKDILEREKAASGTTKFLGQTAGLIGSALTGVGEAKVLGMAGEALGLGAAEGALAKIGSAAAKSAVENALYEAGNETSKALLSDPDQTASQALLNIGTAGALGGILGGSLGAISPLWEATAGKKAEAFLNKITGKINAEPISKEIDNISAEVSSSKKQVYDPFLKETLDKTIELPEPKTSETVFDPFLNKEVSNPNAEAASLEAPVEVAPTATSAPEKIYDPFLKKYVDKGAAAQAISETPPPLPQEFIKKALTAKLEKFIEYLPEGVVGAASSMLGVNPYYAVAAAHASKKLLGYDSKAFSTSLLKFMSSDARIDAPAWKAAADYMQAAIRGQAKLQRAAKAVVNPARMTFPTIFLPDNKSRDKLEKKLYKLKEDQSALFKVSGKVGYYMPEHAVSISNISMNAVNYLESLRPDMAKKMPLDAEPKMSAFQRGEYNRALDIADQPLLVMKAIDEGNLTAADVRHLKIMYPSIYMSMRKELFHQVVENGEEPIPYKKRLNLAVFLEEPLDSTMTPQAILANQGVFLQNPELPSEQQAQARLPQNNKLSKVAGEAATHGQAREKNRVQARA